MIYYNKEYIGVLLGAHLTQFIRNNSMLIDENKISSEKYYVIRLKLK